MNNRVRTLKMISAATLIAGLVAFPTIAGASGSTGGSGSYCVASLSSSNQPVCFNTFGASISYATNGRVSLSNASIARYVSPSELGSSAAISASPQSPASLVLAIDYSGSNYTGTSLVWNGAGCTASSGGNNMPSFFNDLTRSVVAYSGCATTLFANANYGSPAYLVHVNAAVSDLGSFDGTASSQLFCNYYGCH
jgi:hypothetical protein